MSDNFDPYYKWLGIPPDEQPPHHYRLLGVRPFESDPDVIANAVDQRMTHLRTLQSGKNAAHSQKLLNEVSAAKLCLFNAAQKAEYDRQLRGRLAKSAGSVPPTNMAVPPTNMAVPPTNMAAPPTNMPGSPAAATMQMRHPGYAAPGAGMPLAGVSPQTRQPMPQMVQPAALRPAPTNQPAGGQASREDSSDYGEIVGDSSRRRSRSRRQTNSLALPAIAIALLLSALVGVIVFFKSGGSNELLAKHDPSPSKQKAKAAKEKEAKPSDDNPAEEDSEDYSPPPGAVKALLQRLSESVTAGNFEATKTVGGPGGTVFRDLPDKGALLVGFDFGLSPMEESDTLAISSIRGLFEANGQRPILGHTNGKLKSGRRVLAKKGYAVGWLEVAPGDRVTGVRVHFCGISKNGLSRESTYPSDWIGPPGDEPAEKLGNGRKPVVGIAGTSSTLINRLSLILASSGKEAAAAEKPVADDATEEPMPNRATTAEKTPATGAMPPTGAMPATGTMPSAAEMERRVLAKLSGGGETPLIPVPDSDAIGAALAKIQESFKAAYADIIANSAKPSIANAKRWDLAYKFYTDSEVENDPVVRYTMLEEARKLTVKIGDLKAVLMTINKMASRYQIDEVRLAIASLTKAAEVTATALEKGTPAADKRERERREVGQKVLLLIAKAVEQERFADADALAGLAGKMAAGNSLLKQQTAWRKDRLANQHQAYDDAQPALETLKNDPADADANLAAGRYRCLFQEAWTDGLPLLAKGSDPVLKRLAEQELAPPGEPDLQAKLGDEWSAAAESHKPWAPYFKMCARQWYEIAWPRLTGIVSKQSVQGKLEEMLRGHGLTAEYFAGADKFDNRIFGRVDPQIDFEWGQPPPDDLPAQFSVRWTGWLVPPSKKGGQFTIVLDHDAGARLWLDNTLWIDQPAADRGEKKSYQLPAKSPRHLKVEYFSSGKGNNKAHVSLRWSQQGEFPEQPIPAEALFQDKTDAEKVYSQLPVPKPGNNAPLTITSMEPPPMVPLPNGAVPNVPLPPTK